MKNCSEACVFSRLLFHHSRLLFYFELLHRISFLSSSDVFPVTQLPDGTPIISVWALDVAWIVYSSTQGELHLVECQKIDANSLRWPTIKITSSTYMSLFPWPVSFHECTRVKNTVLPAAQCVFDWGRLHLSERENCREIQLDELRQGWLPPTCSVQLLLCWAHLVK